MANRIQLRRGGAQEWANSNPTLAQGELGIELDTGRFKIGDGVTSWNTLRYERPVESTSNTANTLVQRDADGNFAAGTITATIVGNASTAARLSTTRQIQLSSDVTASGTFDGSANLNLTTSLSLVSTLPHYDGTATPTATYNKVTVDAKGRISNAIDYTASNNGTLEAYGLDGTNEGTSAQPYDNDLVALAGLTSVGMIARTAADTMATRTITGTTGTISINNGTGAAGDPTINLITTAVTAAEYNAASLTSTAGSETVNATNFTVDTYGRLTAAAALPIATATQGTLAAAYNAGTTYSRGDKITNASKLYEAIAGISAGAGAPTHSDTSDAGSWRHLGASATPQKGLASFDQEDFDVSAAGHVTMSLAGIDNAQLQNSRVSFADGNAVEHFDLDQELTATTGYRGFNKLNYVKINDTSGNLLFGANNTGDGGAGEIDVNVRSYFSDPDITLDGGAAQTLDKTGDGNLTFQTTQNSSSARTLSILATNAGAGNSGVVVTAENTVTITASDAAGKVQVEDTYFQGDYIASSAATMILDPGDDRAVSGKVQIMGDLQVDGTTTTINSSVTTLDDPIITLGGDTAPASDDNKDRGVEFRYYDASAKVGFFGYDDSASDLGGHTGAFSFLYDATNSSEVFSGTDAGIIAGNLKLTTGTASTSNTTGDLVISGGAGIGGAVNLGSTLNVDAAATFEDDLILNADAKNFKIQLDNGTDKFTVASATGNTLIKGTLDVDGDVDFDANLTVDGTAVDINATLNVDGLIHFENTDAPTIAYNSGTDLYEIQSSDYGALRVDGGGYIDKDVLFNGDVWFNGDLNQKDNSTESWGFRNWLQVRYKGRMGSSAAYTPSYASHDTSNLRVYGGMGVATTLHVGGTGGSQGLFVGKKDSGDTVKFSVLGASGNTTIVGTLTVNDAVDLDSTLNVDGGATFQDDVTINADNKTFKIQNNSAVDKFTVDTDNGNTETQGTLDSQGAFRAHSTSRFDDNIVFQGASKTLVLNNGSGTTKTTLHTTTGNAEFGGNVTITGTADVTSDFNVNTNKFQVTASNGNTTTAGTFNADGAATFQDNVTINADNKLFAIQNNSAATKFSVDTDNGNTDIQGTLNVEGAMTFDDTVGITGVTSVTDSTDQTLSGSYAADGSVRLTGGIGTAKNLAVGGGARVYGNTELTGTLDLNNSADVSGNFVISNTDDASSLADSSVALQVAGGATIDKNTYVGGDFVVYDSGNTRAAFTVTNATGDAATHNDLTVGGNLIVNGTTTTVNSTVTTVDDPIITLGGDTAPGSNDGKDKGVEFRYYDGSAKLGFFGYDRGTSKFVFLTDTTNTSEVITGTDAGIVAGSLNLTGAGTALDVDNNANIDGTLTVDGAIISNVATGSAPFQVASTTKVSNLNADLLDGKTTDEANTASTVVVRDASGNFAAGTITAALTGNASTASTLETARTITVDGVVDGNVSFNGGANVTITTTYADADITALAAMAGTGFVVRTAANTYAQRSISATASSGVTITNGDGVAGDMVINVASATANTGDALVLRDASGNFAAGTITATLTGNVTGDLTGTADLATSITAVANNSTDETTYLTFLDGPTGTQGIETDTGLTYNPSSGLLTTTSVAANLTGNVVGNVTGDLTGNIVGTTTTSKDLNPAADSTYDLGTTSVRWQHIYADDITAGGTITAALTGDVTGNLVGTTSTAKNLNPAADSTYNLGTSTVRWTNVYADNLNASANATIAGNCDVTTNATVGGTLGVTGVLTASGGVSGNVTGDLTGNADTATLATTFTTSANDSTAETVYPVFVDGQTGAQDAETDVGLTYNPSTGVLTTTAVTANLTGAVTGNASTATALATARTIGGTSFDGTADITPATATQAANLSNHDTADLAEGTNLYYTEARVQAKLDNAYEQLRAMLNNLATSTTLTINLSGDPTPGDVVTFGAIAAGGTGYTTATGVATSSSGSGTGLTVDITAVSGIITAVAVNNDGTGYVAAETITITNANASGVKTLGTISAGGTGYSTATGVATSSGGSGTGLTVDITADGSGAVTAVTINDDGSGYAASEVITISGGGGDATIPVSAIHGNGASIPVATVKTMTVGQTLTGATSGTTGVITALGSTSVTVDNVDGFFKKTEVVSSGNVTTLTASSFA